MVSSNIHLSTHTIPINAELLFTPGAFLRGNNVKGNIVRVCKAKGITPYLAE